MTENEIHLAYNFDISILDVAEQEGVKSEEALYRFIQRRVQGLPLEERGMAFRLLARRLAEEIDGTDERDVHLWAAVAVLQNRLAGC